MILETLNFGPYRVIHREGGHKGNIEGRELTFRVLFGRDSAFSRATLPADARVFLKNWFRDQFDKALLVDQSDPYADHLAAMTRQGGAKVELFDDGTRLGDLAYYVHRVLADYVKGAPWNEDGQSWVIEVGVKTGEEEVAYAEGQG